MAVDDVSERAMSFGAIAHHYDRYRPGPPSAAVDWLLPPSWRTAIDIGAGTGALTRLLVGRAGHVIAAEPDGRMAALLAAGAPGTSVVCARAEDLPLGPGTVDAVVGSSMWHWVDEERAVVDAARVLRPGGVLGVLWSGPDRSRPWVAELLARPRGARPPTTPEDAVTRHHHHLRLPTGTPFSPAASHTIEWSLSMTARDVVELACTYSGVIVRPEGDRRRIRDDLAAAVDDHLARTDSSLIELPMRCICWRAVRQ